MIEDDLEEFIGGLMRGMVRRIVRREVEKVMADAETSRRYLGSYVVAKEQPEGGVMMRGSKGAYRAAGYMREAIHEVIMGMGGRRSG